MSNISFLHSVQYIYRVSQLIITLCSSLSSTSQRGYCCTAGKAMIAIGSSLIWCSRPG